MYEITLTETIFRKNPNTKTTYIEVEKIVETVTEREHELTTKDETCRFFRRLGGSETKVMGYTSAGYKCIQLTSTSPDRQIKKVRKYKFTRVDKTN